MEQKHSSSEQGPQRRPSNRRRRRRRRRSQAASPAPPPAANRTLNARAAAAPAAGEAPVPAPDPPDPPGAAPEPGPAREPSPAREPGPAPGPGACPLCAKPVDDLYTAIAYGEHRAPAHFDCVVSLLGKREQLEEGTRLCYLGGGSFGVVQMRPASRSGDRGGTLLIRKRIEVEERDSAPAWREELRLPLPERRVNVAGMGKVPCK